MWSCPSGDRGSPSVFRRDVAVPVSVRLAQLECLLEAILAEELVGRSCLPFGREVLDRLGGFYPEGNRALPDLARTRNMASSSDTSSG